MGLANLWCFARPNSNLVYLIADTTINETVAVDAAFDVGGLRSFAESKGGMIHCKLKLVGSVYSHSHFDHCGGRVPNSFSQT